MSATAALAQAAAAIATASASRADVAKVFAAAGFGARAAELDEWTGRRYVDLVEHMLAVPAAAARGLTVHDVAAAAIDPAYPYTTFFGDAFNVLGAQLSWLERMRTTPHPLLERMTLLWHDHFATGFVPYPDAGMLVRQNTTQRTHALGSFRELVAAMTVDQAMLHWLNGADSATPFPNENYAREFFELFTLGKDPAVYTEADVREAARAFTGWTSNPFLRSVAFDPARHDTGSKSILGTTITNSGANEYLAVIEVALEQPVAATFIARKLVQGFAYNPAPGDPLVAAVASTLRSTDWDITAAMRTILTSDRFRFADKSEGQQRVRQPAEVVVNLFRAVDVPIVDYRIAQTLADLGQALFDPPTVAGWPDGARWLSPGTIIARYRLAQFVFLYRDNFMGQPFTAPAAELDRWAGQFGLADLTASTRGVLERYLADSADQNEDQRRNGVMSLLLISPDWTVV